jgi:hypothetical protein
MRRRTLILPRSDEGSIIVAMLAVMILTGVVSIGMATVITGQKATQHDQTFAQALTGAESGLDSMVAQVKASPSASSFTPLTGNDASTGVSYNASAAFTASTSSWLIDSVGTATRAGQTVRREVQETVKVAGLYDVPLFGDTALTAQTGSGVGVYDSGTNGNAPATSCSVLPDTGLLGLAATTMCTPAQTSTGPAATNGSLTASGSDLSNFSEIDIDNSTANSAINPDATGTCVGDATVCASSQVISQPQKLIYPDSTACAGGIGATASTITGSNYLAAGAVYNVLGNLTLNAAVTANLSNLSSSAITLCFNDNLLIPSLGAAGVTVPWNSYTSSVLPLQFTPRPPATLQFIDTATSTSSSTIYIGDTLNPETAISAIIYAPHANCVVSGHLDLYGTLICGSISAPGGVTVHYDSELKAVGATEQTVSVTNWHEVR